VKPLPRLNTSVATRRAISEALTGRKRKAEVVDRAQATKAARPATEAEKTQRKRALARPRKTDEQKCAEARAAATKRRGAASRRRNAQKAEDMLAARRMGNWPLFWDVKKSMGWAHQRTVFDPTGRVSNGMSRGSKEIVWVKRDLDGRAVAIEPKVDSTY
jgi:hypothetical protein